MSNQNQPVTAPQPTSPLALEPGMEFKVGDCYCCTGGMSENNRPYWSHADSDFYDAPVGHEDLVIWMTRFFDRNTPAARCEWRTQVDCYDRATDREYTDWATVRLIWRRDAPLELDVWLGRDVLPSEETRHTRQEIYIAGEMVRLLDVPFLALPLLPSVPLLTAMRLADVLQDRASDWVVHP